MLRLALVVSTLCVASTALAQANVVVLGLRSIEGDDDVANDLTQQLRDSSRSVPEWVVSDRAVSMAQMSLAHGCDDLDAACLSEIARGLQADRIIYGTVKRTSAHQDYDFSVSLGLFDAASGTIVRNIDHTVPSADVPDALPQHTDRLITRLSSQPSGGVIDVRVSAAEADVMVNGQTVGTTRDGRLRLEGLQAGKYRVEIVKQGYAPHVTVLEIEQGGASNISAVLARSDLAATGGYDETATYDDRRPRQDLRWLGWTLVGVGGAALIGAGVSVFKIKSIDEDEEFLDYRDAVAQGNADAQTPADVVQDVCNAARSGARYERDFMGDVEDIAAMCDEADTFEVLQWVFLGSAIVTGGLGAYLLLSQEDGGYASATQPSSFALTPRVSRDTAMLNASLRF